MMRTRSRLWWSLVLLSGAACAQQPAELRLTLPPAIYTVVGQPLGVWFDNVVLTPTPEACRFEVSCPVGSSDARRWLATPTAEQVGEHPWRLRVLDAAGAEVASGQSRLFVGPADRGAGRALKLLVIGDSLTNATTYVNELARLLSLPGNPSWTMLGSNKVSWAAPGVVHEGYGGWTWQRFATHWEPAPDPAQRKFSSPFVFLDAAGQPKLDVGRYFAEKCGGQVPDVITVLLGINDCFGANPESQEAMDQSIDRMFSHADTFVAALRAAAPQAVIGLGLTTPPNAREAGFQANYQGRYTRWGWKRIQHRLVQRQLAKYAGQEAQGLWLVPTELNLDPVDGYPDNNGVHPNAVGYQQIGNSFYAWLKHTLR
ncbi:MAG: hypothetical protein IT204_13160 [Fimbriimonadaceae bacterium]|nr:hypothetical protein [Fimbriimonadaceae bacterium]